MKISLNLDRNNLGKKATVGDIDRLLQSITDNPKVLTNTFKRKYVLTDGYSAWLDIGRQMVAIVGADRTPVGGLAYDTVGKYLSTVHLKLRPAAQGKGLMQQLLQHILLEHGGIYSSSSISPGAALIFKRLADKYTGYVVWPSRFAKSYAKISSWKSLGIYKVFPFITAPDGNEYPIDALEASFGRSANKGTRVNNQHWKFGEVFISKNGKPPTGFKRLGT